MHKEYEVGTFLDIEGAFINVQSEVFFRAMERSEVESLSSLRKPSGPEWKVKGQLNC